MARRMTRRQILKAAGVTTAAATSPWWMVRGSHAQRAKKLVFWHLPNFTPSPTSCRSSRCTTSPSRPA